MGFFVCHPDSAKKFKARRIYGRKIGSVETLHIPVILIPPQGIEQEESQGRSARLRSFFLYANSGIRMTREGFQQSQEKFHRFFFFNFYQWNQNDRGDCPRRGLSPFPKIAEEAEE